MAQLSILEYPDPRLRRPARPVRSFDMELWTVIDDLFDTLYATGGFGLAAPQVGIDLRVVVIDLSEAHDAPQVFVNPECVSRNGLALVEEGCLSVPGFTGLVKRAVQVGVAAADRWGVVEDHALDGLAAVCLQHEIDHLDGRLFVDRMPFFKRLSFRRRRPGAGWRTTLPVG